ncbi:hypothetical protein PHMEG_0002013 [Phytophthora megakarya]|uniref:Uncharacterized protein n=1 Tax=Phytophthora megakarya TaxID=4795 RepID=A0A225WZ42_9STRA|nr:hypothetical protein PHMEG_0002013 [Phytophthora megakarya]
MVIDTSSMAGMEGLVPFLESIGSLLTALTITRYPRYDIGGNVNSIIRSYRNLQELTLSSELVDLVDIQLHFTEYHAAKPSLPELSLAWTDVTKITNSLSDSNNPLAKCTRRLNDSYQQSVFVYKAAFLGGAPSNSDCYVNTPHHS